MIPLEQCENGTLYRLDSRNLALGVYRAKDRSFIGIRTKFANRFLDQEFHWDTGAPHGTAKPAEALTACPITNTDPSLGFVCTNCHAPCTYVQFAADDGTGVTVRGAWVHTKSTNCDEVRAVGVANEALFAWLDAQLKDLGLVEPLGRSHV